MLLCSATASDITVYLLAARDLLKPTSKKITKLQNFSRGHDEAVTGSRPCDVAIIGSSTNLFYKAGSLSDRRELSRGYSSRAVLSTHEQ